MRHLSERCEPSSAPYAYLEMNFDERQKVRNRVVASNGEAVGVHLERGTSLKDGDALRATDGAVFVVRSAKEPLSIVRCEVLRDLARAAYHLGNRHVRLQVNEEEVLYQRDHVLDDMLRHFGLSVEHVESPFEPEPGAYHRSHASGSAHGHSHSHGHEERHSPSNTSSAAGDAPAETESLLLLHSHPHPHPH